MKEKSKMKILRIANITIVLLLITLLQGGCALFTESQQDENANKIDIVIAEGIASLTEPFVDENGYIAPDETKLTAAADAVFKWAQELKREKKIDGCAYCKDGYSVSFFLNDGTTTVYSPSIEDFYSGNDNPCVYIIDQFHGTDRINKGITWDPAGEITSRIKYFSSTKFENLTINSLKETIGSLDEKHVRAIFWMGHGTLFESRAGSTMISFSIGEKESDKANDSNKADLLDNKDKEPAIVTVCSSGKKSAKYYSVTHVFFEQYMNNVQGGLFFSGACHGAQDGGIMADTFLKKGFDAYVGNTNSVQIMYAYAIANDLAKHLAERDDKGNLLELEQALKKASDENNTRGFYIFNDMLGGGHFIIIHSGSYYLIDQNYKPRIFLDFTSSDKTVDFKKVSVKCIKISRDGEQKLYDRYNFSTNKSGDTCLQMDEIDKGDTVEIDISYESFLLKKVVLRDIDPANVITHKIDLSLAWLTIAVKEKNESQPANISIQVIGLMGESGVGGLILKPILTYDKDSGPVYKLPLEPGKYTIKISGKNYLPIEEKLTIDNDTTVTYSLRTKMDSLDVDTILKDHLKTVVDSYPIMDTERIFSVKQDASEEYYMHNPGWNASDLTGLLSAYIQDYDQDGQSELLTIRFESYGDPTKEFSASAEEKLRNKDDQYMSNYSEYDTSMFLEIYEVDPSNGKVILQDNKHISGLGALLTSNLLSIQADCFVYQFNNKSYIGIDRFEREQGGTIDTAVYQYNGNRISFVKEVSYSQHGGSGIEVYKSEREPLMPLCLEWIDCPEREIVKKIDRDEWNDGKWKELLDELKKELHEVGIIIHPNEGDSGISFPEGNISEQTDINKYYEAESFVPLCLIQNRHENYPQFILERNDYSGLLDVFRHNH